VAAAITAADPSALAAQLEATGHAEVTTAAGTVTLGSDDVIVTRSPRAGWTVASDAGYTLALETSITPELRSEGLAREAIRLIQDARRADGLDVSDRIVLWWEAAAQELASALAEHEQLIAGEVLAAGFHRGTPGAADPRAAGGRPAEHADSDLGLTFWLARAEP
jgi:isoleucyl-tRNA synthetase